MTWGSGPGQTKPRFDTSIYGRPLLSFTPEEHKKRLEASQEAPPFILMTPAHVINPQPPPLHLVPPSDIKALVERNRKRIDAGRIRVDSPIALAIMRPVLTLGDDHG